MPPKKKNPSGGVGLHCKSFTEVFESLTTSVIDGKLAIESVFEYLYGHGKMHGIYFNTKFGIRALEASADESKTSSSNVKANYSLRTTIYNEKLEEARAMLAASRKVPEDSDDESEEYLDMITMRGRKNTKGGALGKRKRGRQPAEAEAPVRVVDEKWARYADQVMIGTMELDAKGNLIYVSDPSKKSSGFTFHSSSHQENNYNNINSSLNSPNRSPVSSCSVNYLGVMDIETQQKVARDPVKGNSILTERLQQQLLVLQHQSGCGEFGYSAAVTVCGRSVNLGSFKTPKEAAIAHDRALIRASGPCNCIDSELNYAVSSYAQDSLDKFTYFDSILKKQLFGSSWNGPRPCDFGYLLKPSPPRMNEDGTYAPTNFFPNGINTRGTIAANRVKRDKHPGTSHYEQSHEEDHAPYFKSPAMQQRAEKREKLISMIGSMMNNTGFGLNRHRGGSFGNSSPMASRRVIVSAPMNGRTMPNNSTSSSSGSSFGLSQPLPPRSSLVDYESDNEVEPSEEMEVVTSITSEINNAAATNGSSDKKVEESQTDSNSPTTVAAGTPAMSSPGKPKTTTHTNTTHNNSNTAATASTVNVSMDVNASSPPVTVSS